jgi:Fe2+ transport system protein B
MTKRNTRIDDAELSETEQAKIGAIIAKATPEPSPMITRIKPKAKSKLSPEALKAQAEVEKMTTQITRLQSRLFRTVNQLQKLEKRRRYFTKKAAAA